MARGRGWREQNRYHTVRKGSLCFSPDNQRVSYAAGKGKTQSIVVDGQEGQQYDTVFMSHFSQDSQRLAYIAKVAKKDFVVVTDGQEGQHYEDVFTPRFSPDSQRLAYGARVGKREFVVADGQEQPQHGGIGEGSLVFSPDSRWLAYVAIVGKKQVVVIDGQEQPQHDGIVEGSLVFSPDSRRIAYGVQMGNKQIVVIDGQAQAQYDIAFTEEGIGKIIFDSPNHLHYIAQRGNAFFLTEEDLA